MVSQGYADVTGNYGTLGLYTCVFLFFGFEKLIYLRSRRGFPPPTRTSNISSNFCMCARVCRKGHEILELERENLEVEEWANQHGPQT